MATFALMAAGLDFANKNPELTSKAIDVANKAMDQKPKLFGFFGGSTSNSNTSILILLIVILVILIIICIIYYVNTYQRSNNSNNKYI